MSTYTHTLDNKGRVAVPARFRTYLPDGLVVAEWMEGSLGVWPKARWEALHEMLRTVPPDSATGRRFVRSMFSSAMELVPDTQGRIPIGSDLRDYAGLTLDAPVAFVGAGDHAEIWAPGRWAAYKGASPSLEELFEHVPGLSAF